MLPHVQKLVVEKPEDPLSFLINELRAGEVDALRVIVHGGDNSEGVNAVVRTHTSTNWLFILRLSHSHAFLCVCMCVCVCVCV